MVLNPNKCSFIFLGIKETENISLSYKGYIIKPKNEEKILGITIDNKLNFDHHVSNICKNGNRKLSALSRISYYTTQKQLKLLISAFVKSQFNYCPLIWMFCSRKANNKINKIHERSLRLISQDYQSSFEELLLNNKDITIHQSCLQKLVVEAYKAVNDLSLEIVKEIFPLNNLQHNLRNANTFYCENPKTNKYGLNSICNRANQVWKNIPVNLKNAKSLTAFKTNLAVSGLIKCQCPLCKIYIVNLGFI